MAKESHVDVVPGFYVDLNLNGYGVVGVAENPTSGERVVVYRPVTEQGKSIGALFFEPAGSFKSKVDSKKGFKHFMQLPRQLGLGRSVDDPGSHTDKKV